jgi:hypothetical protein
MFGQQQRASPTASKPAAPPIEENAALAPALLKNAVERLEAVIDQETAALTMRRAVDLNDFNDRKSHGFVELSRAMRHFEGAALDQSLVLCLTGLRTKLETNRAVLKMHLEAVKEVSTVVADAMRHADSDGTYAPTLRKPAGYD